MEIEQKIELLSRHLTPQRLEKIMRVSADRTRYVTVVLENIFYTQNFSAVTRTCECLGIHIHRKTNQPAAQAAAALKAAGYRIVAAMPTADAKPFTELNLSAGKVAVAMGNETDGTGEEIKNLADEFITIPMYGFTESFNVSVSAALILHDLTKRLRASDIDWRLSAEELAQLRYRWIRRCIKQGDKIEAEYEARLGHPNLQ